MKLEKAPPTLKEGTSFNIAAASATELSGCDYSAEVEIRMVFNQIAEICIRDYPHLYGDFLATDLPDGTKSYRPKLRSKV